MGLIRHFPVFIIITPLVTAAVLPALAHWRKSLAQPLAALAITASLVLCLALIFPLSESGPISYYLSSWEPPFGIEIRIDFLGLFMMLIVTSVGLAAVIYSGKYIGHEIDGEKVPTYYSLSLLLTGSMLGFSATGDIFNMFVFIEIMSITSYALVAINGSASSIRAAFKYLWMGAPSSILVLLAISFLYTVTGTLNMGDLTAKIATSSYSQVIVISFGIFVTGFAAKAALFPLHLWLPDAHSIAPSPVSALLSGLVVKMGIFGIIRLIYSVYTLRFSPDVREIVSLICFIGAAAVIYGSVMALKQRDFKRMIAFSTVAHVGYILAGIGLMNRLGMTGGIFHILDHALVKTCFFFVAGSIIYKTGYRNIEELKGAARRMPLSCACFALASASAIGIPPSAGFISKWYLVSGSLAAGEWVVAVMILLGSALAAAYCLRIVYYMFFLPPEAGHWEEVTTDVPLTMLVPSGLFSLASLLFGIFAFLVLPSLEKAIEILL